MGGDSTCTTRSTAPMSMPSSSDEVATTAGSRPDFSASSTSARCSRDTDPWWAEATGDLGGAPAAPSRPAPSARPGSAPCGSGSPVGPLVGQLVEPGWSAARPAAGSWRTRSSAVGLDQVEHPLLDLPARSTSAARSPAAEPLQLTGRLAELAHVLDRDDDRQVPTA